MTDDDGRLKLEQIIAAGSNETWRLQRRRTSGDTRRASWAAWSRSSREELRKFPVESPAAMEQALRGRVAGGGAGGGGWVQAPENVEPGKVSGSPEFGAVGCRIMHPSVYFG